jgi:hypothetical protein
MEDTPTTNTTSKLTNWMIGISAMVMAGGIGFLGTKAMETNDAVVKISVEVPALKQEITDFKSEVKSDVAALVTRPELESRISETKVDNAQIRLEQQKVSLEIYKLQTENELRRQRESHQLRNAPTQ